MPKLLLTKPELESKPVSVSVKVSSLISPFQGTKKADVSAEKIERIQVGEELVIGTGLRPGIYAILINDGEEEHTMVSTLLFGEKVLALDPESISQ